MTDKLIITSIAILSVAILTAIAMFKGIDGALYMTSLAVIGGLAGYELKVIKDKNKPL